MGKEYFTTSDHNKCRSGRIDAKIKEKELVKKYHITNLLKNSDINIKLTALATIINKIKNKIR